MLQDVVAPETHRNSPCELKLQTFESPHKNFAWWAVTWRTSQTTELSKLGGGPLLGGGSLLGGGPLLGGGSLLGGGPLLGGGRLQGTIRYIVIFMSISRHYRWNCCGSDSWWHFIICSPPYTSLLLGTKVLIKRSLPDLPGLPGFPGLPSCFSTSKKEKEKRASCTGGSIGTYY